MIFRWVLKIHVSKSAERCVLHRAVPEGNLPAVAVVVLSRRGGNVSESGSGCLRGYERALRLNFSEPDLQIPEGFTRF